MANGTGSIMISESPGYMENCTLTGNQGTKAGGIIIWVEKLKLCNTVLLENMAPDIMSKNDILKHFNTLETYNCLFKHDNTTLISNSTEFKLTGIKDGFLKESSFYHESNLETKETQFASSELLKTKFFLQLMSFATY